MTHVKYGPDGHILYGPGNHIAYCDDGEEVPCEARVLIGYIVVPSGIELANCSPDDSGGGSRTTATGTIPSGYMSLYDVSNGVGAAATPGGTVKRWNVGACVGPPTVDKTGDVQLFGGMGGVEVSIDGDKVFTGNWGEDGPPPDLDQCTTLTFVNEFTSYEGPANNNVGKHGTIMFIPVFA